MSDSTESTIAIWNRLFKELGAKLGKNWLDSVASGWTETSLHSLVVTNGTLSVAKTREIYGHFCPKTQIKPDFEPYWKPKPAEAAELEFVRLNTMEHDAEKRMNQLRTDAIGGVLMVTTVLIEADGSASSPFITIVAAPLVATFTPPDEGKRYLLY
jgi:hypothetical protein